MQKNTKKYKKIEIFQDKYNGLTYKKLSGKYDVSEDTLASRFSRGIWKEDYDKFEKELMDEGIKEAKKNLGKLTKDASIILAKALEIFEVNPELSVKSAIEILNRQFGKSVDINANLNMDMQPFSELMKELREELDAENKRTNKNSAETKINKG